MANSRFFCGADVVKITMRGRARSLPGPAVARLAAATSADTDREILVRARFLTNVARFSPPPFRTPLSPSFSLARVAGPFHPSAAFFTSISATEGSSWFPRITSKRSRDRFLYVRPAIGVIGITIIIGSLLAAEPLSSFARFASPPSNASSKLAASRIESDVRRARSASARAVTQRSNFSIIFESVLARD